MNEEKKLYPFDLSINEVEIEVDAAEGSVVAARMRKPTDGEEFAREEQSSVKYAELNNGKEESVTVIGSSADGRMFDNIATELKGFVLHGEDEALGMDWRPATPELLAEIPLNYKQTFIGGTRIFTAKLIKNKSKVVVLGGPRISHVNFTVGNEKAPAYALDFYVPLPSESEREQFNRAASEFSVSKEEKGTSFLRFNLRPCVEHFDKLMLKTNDANIIGGTVNGKSWSECTTVIEKQQFLDAISPVIKHRVLTTVMGQYNAKLRD